MDGMHDLGGRDGFGHPVVEPHEAVFHDDWEGRVFALAGGTMAQGVYGTPEFRHAMERMYPLHYLSASYYERWLTATATLLVEKEVITRGDLDEAVEGGFPLSAPPRTAPLRDPGPDVTDPRFGIGQRARVRNAHPHGHTRCPGYVRGKHGVVVRYDGPCNFDDVEAHSDAKRLEPLYCVSFEGVELWGADAEENTGVRVDLFECYLEEP